MKKRLGIVLISMAGAILIGAVGFAAGGLTASLAQPATPPVEITGQPNQNCFLGPEMDMMEKWNDSQLVACKVTGMSPDSAEAFANEAGVSVRVAYRDGEYFALTEDFREDRINLWIHAGVVIRADAW